MDPDVSAAVVSVLTLALVVCFIQIARLSSKLKFSENTWEEAFDTGVTFGMISAAQTDPLDFGFSILSEADEHNENEEAERLYAHYSPVYPADSL